MLLSLVSITICAPLGEQAASLEGLDDHEIGNPSFGKVHHNSRIESWMGACKEHYAYNYVPKSSNLLVGTGVWKISSVACGFTLLKSIILIIRKV